MTINWNRRTYTEEEFVDAWLNEPSIAAVARKLDLVIFGSTYKTLKATAKALDLPEVERLGQGWKKGNSQPVVPAKPIEEWLIYGSNINSSTLKEKLFRSGLKNRSCEGLVEINYDCGRTEWAGKELKFHLDHIDGDNINNVIENLRILCPNCHAQTETYCRGKDRTKTWEAKAEKRQSRRQEKYCAWDNCSKSISLHSTHCKSHAGMSREKTKIDWPSIKELRDMVRASNFTQVSQKLGVSDNAVRKRLKRYGVDTKTLEMLE